MSVAATSAVAGGEVDADAVKAVVTALPQIAAMASSGAVPLATYLPGRRVLGVRVDEESVAVAVVGAAGVTVADMDAAIRTALAPLAGPRRIDVRVEDVRLPGDSTQD